MATHNKWYPENTETIVPWNAQYTFPSQANKAVKTTPRIPPKSGGRFFPGNTIRLEFPAQGYVNPMNTTFEFDVTLSNPGGLNVARFQNNIQSIFHRIRLVYGSQSLEDIDGYNVVVRALTEWTATNQTGTLDQTSISEGIGGVVYGAGGSAQGNINVRQAYIQGISGTPDTGSGAVPNSSHGLTEFASACTRRYQVSFALGMFTQDKLIPTKWMASQFAIEITLAAAQECIFQPVYVPGSARPTYAVTNCNLIPEVLEFDSSYDVLFLKGLQDGGVPMKFSSWHKYSFGTGGGTKMSLQIQEKSRSVKAIFCMLRRSPDTYDTDSGALLYDSAFSGSAGVAGSTLNSYQFRIGARYFPAAPVQCCTDWGTGVSNGGAEAFIELQKALNCVGDYRLSTGANTLRWAMPSTCVDSNNGPSDTNYQIGELDFLPNVTRWSALGVPIMAMPTNKDFHGIVGSTCFAMSTSLETSNGMEVSGLNAEEQSDITLIADYHRNQQLGYALEVYVLYDAMLVLRPNNVIGIFSTNSLYRTHPIKYDRNNIMPGSYGLNSELQYYEIELDSLDNSGPNRTGESASNWPRFELSRPLENVAAIKIIEATIPFTYHVITPTNQTFSLTELSGGSRLVTLPVGNYDANTLSTALAAALTSASANSYNYTVTYNAQTYKLKIVSSSGALFTLNFGLPTNAGNVNPRLYIGFPGGDTQSQLNGELTTPNAILITGANYIYVNSSNLGPDTKLFLPLGAKNLSVQGVGPQVGKIPVNCLPGSTIFWQDPDPQKWFNLEDRSNIPSLDFYLTLGNTSTVLDLNGLGFSLKVGVLLREGDGNMVEDMKTGDPIVGRMNVKTFTPKKKRKA